MVISSGCLLFKIVDGQVLFLLAHAKGSSKRANWGIPKGHVESGELLEVAARRETFEEIGIIPEAIYYLGHVRYTNTKKIVHCYAGEFPHDQEIKYDNVEIDDCKFFTILDASTVIIKDQLSLLLTLEKLIGKNHG
jgi:predicted NUDIX family NTP pyrophosphohydrolase